MFWKKTEEENPYWISFTDLMSGFMVIFILVSLFLFAKEDEKGNPDPLKGKYTELVNIFREKFSDIPEIDVDTVNAVIRFLITENEKTTFFLRAEREPTEYCEEVLDKFIPVYYDELQKIKEAAQDSFEIREIRIEGHTDSQGEYLYNLKLSSQRALKVQEYIIRGLRKKHYPSDFQNFVRANSIACGYSFSHPLDKNGKPTSQTNLPEDFNKSRRVEFRILLEYKNP